MNVNNIIYEVIAGSRAYNLNTETSDTDIRGIYIENENEILGIDIAPQKNDETQDTQYYPLRKFIELLCACNPNIIEMLYVDESDILQMNEYGSILRNNRDLFLTQRARKTFLGYAMAQLKKIKGRERWINNPQECSAPTVDEFMITKKIGDIHIEVEGEGKVEFITDKSDREITYFDIDSYRQKFRQWKQYWRWKEDRNPTRSKLEESFGYDTKNALHLIRLLLMAKEILKDGTVVVKRPDRGFLLDIRNGVYTYQQIIEISENLRQEIELIESNLPLDIDKKQVNSLVGGLYKKWLSV